MKRRQAKSSHYGILFQVVYKFKMFYVLREHTCNVFVHMYTNTHAYGSRIVLVYSLQFLQSGTMEKTCEPESEPCLSRKVLIQSFGTISHGHRKSGHRSTQSNTLHPIRVAYISFVVIE